MKLIDPYLAVSTETEEVDEIDTESAVVTLKTLVTKMAQLASFEASHSPKQTVKVKERKCRGIVVFFSCYFTHRTCHRLPPDEN